MARPDIFSKGRVHYFSRPCTLPTYFRMTEAVRLARNLDTVEANIRLFGKIMDETDIPGTENANDKKLLEKLDVACHKMQERLTILLSELDPENYENVFMNGLRNLDTFNL